MPQPTAGSVPPEKKLAQQLDRFLAGDETVAVEIYERYQRRMLALADRKIGPHLRQKIQPESIVVTVFRSVMMGLAAGKYQLPENGSLWNLMAYLTNRKILKRNDVVKSVKRGGRVEMHGQPPNGLVESASREPTPDEAAAFAEQLQVIRSRLKPDTFAVLEMLMDDYKIGEIAERQQVSRWSIRRRLDGIKNVFRNLFDEEMDVPEIDA